MSLSAQEASGLFGVRGTSKVDVSKEGKVTVTVPTFVGFLMWDGSIFQSHLQEARDRTQAEVEAADGLLDTRKEMLDVREYALDPAEIDNRRTRSIGA